MPLQIYTREISVISQKCFRFPNYYNMFTIWLSSLCLFLVLLFVHWVTTFVFYKDAPKVMPPTYLHEIYNRYRNTIAPLDRAILQLQNGISLHCHYYQQCIFSRDKQEPVYCTCKRVVPKVMAPIYFYIYNKVMISRHIYSSLHILISSKLISANLKNSHATSLNTFWLEYFGKTQGCDNAASPKLRPINFFCYPKWKFISIAKFEYMEDIKRNITVQLHTISKDF